MILQKDGSFIDIKRKIGDRYSPISTVGKPIEELYIGEFLTRYGTIYIEVSHGLIVELKLNEASVSSLDKNSALNKTYNNIAPVAYRQWRADKA